MKKNSTLLNLLSLFMIVFLSIQSYSLNAKNKIHNTNGLFDNSIHIKNPKNEDKNLIKGVWSRTDMSGEINISEVLDNGWLNAEFYNPKMIPIEKAAWTDSSNVLRIYILFREDNYPGSSYTLNYLAEKDLLLGVYFDALTNKSTTVSFKRIK